jgi:hypothetical protein
MDLNKYLEVLHHLVVVLLRRGLLVWAGKEVEVEVSSDLTLMGMGMTTT